MKLLLLLLLLPGAIYGQDTITRHMLRIYEDNDIIKLFGEMSDKGYTNGTRIDYFYTGQGMPRFFIDRWMPKAGKNAVNTFGWSLTQSIFTPEDIETTQPDISDWPYSGALYLSHSLHSSDRTRGYNIQTELVAGVMGKASLAEPVQKFVHRNINSPYPMGWDKQYPTDVLVNINLAIEKRLLQYYKLLDISGGTTAMAGTLINGLSVYGLVRIGRMIPYYNGYIGQYNTPFRNKRNKLQAYVALRPCLEWIGYNAVLEGGVFSGKSDYYMGNTADVNHGISRRLDIMAVLAYGNVGLSFTQRIMPRLVDGFSHQRLGNISLYVGW